MTQEPQKRLSDYIKLTSLSWWSGMALILLGLARLFAPALGIAPELIEVVDTAGQVLAATQGVPPDPVSQIVSGASLIGMGTGLIGIRAAQTRR